MDVERGIDKGKNFIIRFIEWKRALRENAKNFTDS